MSLSAAVAISLGEEPDIGTRARRRRAGADLPEPLAGVLAGYRAWLASPGLSDSTRRDYGARVAGFLDWLATRPDLTTQGDPFTQSTARDRAMDEYRRWLTTVRKATPWTVTAHLTALAHFYAHHLGLGAAVVTRERVTAAAPDALTPGEQRRFIRACTRCGSVRNAALGLLLLYTGLRVTEVQALDVADLVLADHRGTLTVGDGEGGIDRAVPLHHAARVTLRAWLDLRSTHRGADGTRALFLTRRGDRVRSRALHYIVTELGLAAGLVHAPGHPDAGTSRVHPGTLRRTFATQLLRGGVDAVTIADLTGQATLSTTRAYPRSAETDRDRAIDTALVTAPT